MFLRQAFLAAVMAACAMFSAHAAPVMVSVGEANGRGLARLRGSECLVIVPAHLIPDSVKRRNGATRMQVTGPGGAKGDAVFSAAVGLPDDDTALLRVTSNERLVCDEGESAELKGKQAATLVMRGDRGDLVSVPVDILSTVDQLIEIGGRSEFFRLSEMMSGATLIESGRVRGMLLSAATDEDRGLAIQTDYLAGLLGAWVKDPSANVSELRDALAIIQSAIDMKPTGDIGQIAAAEALVQAGSSLAGADLRGLYFSGANLTDAQFAETQLSAANLRFAKLERANLSASFLGFADLTKSVFAQAIADRSRFYFAVADNANFKSAKLASSNWFGASARDADFSGADLAGVSFAFADLRGANFSGANLTNTLFVGAAIEGARFDGAVASNTDFTGAMGSGSQFSATQKKMLCAREFYRSGSVRVDVVEVVPSTKFDSGKDYDDVIFGGQVFLAAFGLNRLKRCELMARYPAGRDIIWEHGGIERFSEEVKLFYDTDLLDKGGRRSAFKKRVIEHAKRMKGLVETANFVEAESSAHTDLTNAIRANIKTANLEGEAFLDSEAVELLVLAEVPKSSELVDWLGKTRRRVGDEGNRNSIDERNARFKNYWPAIFPAGTSMQQLRPDDYDLFKQWTLRRAKDLPRSLRMHTNNALRVRPNSKYSEEAGQAVSFDILAGLDANSVRWRAAETVPSTDASDGITIEVNGTSLGKTALKLAIPREGRMVSIPDSLAQELSRYSLRRNLTVRVDGVKLAPTNDARYPDQKIIQLTGRIEKIELVGRGQDVLFTKTY